MSMKLRLESSHKPLPEFMYLHIIHSMQITRTIDHGDGHTDIEALFVGEDGEFWAVIECNCLLSTPELLPEIEGE